VGVRGWGGYRRRNKRRTLENCGGTDQHDGVENWGLASGHSQIDQKPPTVSGKGKTGGQAEVPKLLSPKCGESTRLLENWGMGCVSGIISSCLGKTPAQTYLHGRWRIQVRTLWKDRKLGGGRGGK
jgi:hypothetical protein